MNKFRTPITAQMKADLLDKFISERMDISEADLWKALAGNYESYFNWAIDNVFEEGKNARQRTFHI